MGLKAGEVSEFLMVVVVMMVVVYLHMKQAGCDDDDDVSAPSAPTLPPPSIHDTGVRGAQHREPGGEHRHEPPRRPRVLHPRP